MKTGSVRLIGIAAALAAVLSGCERKEYRHRPPEGFGAIVLDNRSANEIDVFIDGEGRGRLRSYGDRAYDLEPGVHRLVLSDRIDHRHAAWDVDVIEARLTVIRIRISPWDPAGYDVDVALRTP